MLLYLLLQGIGEPDIPTGIFTAAQLAQNQAEKDFVKEGLNWRIVYFHPNIIDRTATNECLTNWNTED